MTPLPTIGDPVGHASGRRPEGGWSELQIAAIEELVDLGTAYGLPYLADVSRVQVGLICRSRGLLGLHAAARLGRDHAGKPVACVSRRFTGSFTGNLLVLMSGPLMRALAPDTTESMNKNAPVPQPVRAFGTTLLTHCIAGIATILGLGLKPGPAETAMGDPRDLVPGDGRDSATTAFFFDLDLSLDGKPVAAALVMPVSGATEDSLKQYLEAFLETQAAR